MERKTRLRAAVLGCLLIGFLLSLPASSPRLAPEVLMRAIGDVKAARPTRAKVLRDLEAGHAPGAKITSRLLVSESSDYRQERLTLRGRDPLLSESRDVVIDVYTPTGTTGVKPTVLIVSPTGGENILDRWYARAFTAAGLRAVLLRSWDRDRSDALDFGRHDRFSVRAVSAIRHTLDVLEVKHAGIIGASLGAIYSSLALPIEPRLTTAVLVEGGGPLWRTIAISAEQNLQRVRQLRFETMGVRSLQDYGQKLAKNVVLDPVTVAHPTDRRNLWFIVAEQDVTVPTTDQLELWRAWGSPRITRFANGHVGGIIRACVFNRHEIARFFAEHLRDDQSSER